MFLRAIDGSKQLRVGDHRCQLDINRDGGGWDDLEMISGSYGADDTICADKVGARMIPKTWYCLEVHYNGPGSEVQVFWDNQNVEQLHVKATRIATNADKKSRTATTTNTVTPPLSGVRPTSPNWSSVTRALTTWAPPQI